MASSSQDSLNFTLLREYFRKQFIDYFEKVSSADALPAQIKDQKSVYFDENLLPVVGYVLGQNPPSCKIKQTLILEPKAVSTAVTNSAQPLPGEQCIVFVLRPTLANVREVISQMRRWKEEKSYHLLFIPRRTIECDELLEEEHKFREDRVSQIALDLIPLEDDILSLELPDSFSHQLLQDDDTYKVYVQNSIQRLETVFGPIKYKYAKGDDSCQILQRLHQHRHEDPQPNQDSEIDCMVLLDRTIDLVTPFCVAMNYEGLIDEVYGVQSCTAHVDSKILHPDKKDIPKHQTDLVQLNNNDEIFAEVRNKHFDCLQKIFS